MIHSSRLDRRPERKDDEAFRFALYRDSHGAIFAGVAEPLRETVLRQQFLAQDSGQRGAHPDGRFDIVLLDDVSVGRIVTSTVAGTLWVVDLAIVAAVRRRGIATRLLHDVLADAAAARRTVRLRVAHGNAGARRLYERLGFVEAARSEIDALMEWCPRS